MTLRQLIKLNEFPTYPSDNEAKSYAGLFRSQTEGVEDCHLAFRRYWHSPSIDALCTWGCNNIYFVYGIPPAGFYIAKPENVLTLQAFEGWMLEYQPQENIFNLLIKASRDGIDFFRQERDRLKG